MIGVVPYSAWPTWLQMFVMVPNALLVGYVIWGWWPKSKREWNRLCWVLAYLIVFFSVMIFVFHME